MPDYSNTIVIVRPVNQPATDCLTLPQNRQRLFPSPNPYPISTAETSLSDGGRSREATPAVLRDSLMEIRLELNLEPTNPPVGFVFGSQDSTCNVILDKDKSSEISGIHFTIDFNWTSGLLRLNSRSRNGTEMLRDDHSIVLKRGQMQFLPPGEYILLRAGKLDLSLIFPNRGMDQAEYENNWTTYRDKYRDQPSNLGHADFLSGVDTQTYIRRTGIKTTYVLYEKIGDGNFGEVYKAADYRTGSIFAAKELTVKEVEKSRREVNILQSLSHVRFSISNSTNANSLQDHIVRFQDFVDQGKVFTLIMEYIAFGNLREQQSLSPLSKEETTCTSFQALEALAYLHDKNIVHRDLKPKNILVYSRLPLTIKLSDFGLAKQADVLKTFCGTLQYIAPEVCKGIYGWSVDIWALGLVGYELLRPLPEAPGERMHDPKGWSKKWTDKITQMLESRRSNPVKIPLVQTLQRMLISDPSARPSAKECLRDDCFNHFSAAIQSLPCTESEQSTIIDSATFSKQWHSEEAPDSSSAG
ncbi:MAG: hypothetical protein M1837_006406 [Sclerophora amabilis]|nr:MAG: hypothetical protein M1837_006406 [Sclerophora amabilis]